MLTDDQHLDISHEGHCEIFAAHSCHVLLEPDARFTGFLGPAHIQCHRSDANRVPCGMTTIYIVACIFPHSPTQCPMMTVVRRPLLLSERHVTSPFIPFPSTPSLRASEHTTARSSPLASQHDLIRQQHALVCGRGADPLRILMVLNLMTTLTHSFHSAHR